MQPFLLLLFVALFFVFLFFLYCLSNEDFVFLRRNVNLEQVFNLAFMSAFASIFAARLLFVLLNFEQKFLNPFVFVLFPYHPGLLLSGGVFGGLLFVFFYSLRKKLPAQRLFDFFSVSLLFTLAVSFVGLTTWAALLKKSLSIATLPPLFYTILSVVFLLVLLPLHRRNDIADGSLGLVFLLGFSSISFLGNILAKPSKLFFFTGVEDITFIVVFVVSLILLARQEKLISLWKNRK